MPQVFAVLVLEDDALPAVHLPDPLRRLAVVPPAVGPTAVDACGLGPGAAIGHEDGTVVGPDIPAAGVGIAVEASLQPREILPAPRTARFPFRIGAQAVPGLLQGSVVAAEVQAFRLTGEGETVGGRVARILQVELPELLRRGHIGGAAQGGEGLVRIIEQLAARVRGQQFVAFRQSEVAHQGIMELTHDGVRCAVLQPGGETDLSLR